MRRAALALCFALLAMPAAGYAQGMGMPAPPDATPASAKPKILDKVGIDQKIGQQLPLDLEFVDDHGRAVHLGDYFGQRPVVLALAYYECPMLCTQVLTSMTGSLKTLSFDAGTDFDVVVVSINPREGPGLAAEKKATYVEHYGRPQTKDGWHFLTGQDAAIHTLADAIGFRYAFSDDVQQYAHAASIYVATPKGVVARYLLGIEFPPRSLRLALVEASENRLGTVTDQLLLFCYHYDPATGKYGAVVLRSVRIGAVATVVGFLTFLTVSLRRERRDQRTPPSRI